MTKKTFYLIHGILIIIFLVSAALPVLEYRESLPHNKYMRGFVAYIIFGGWIGFLLLIINLKVSNPEKKSKLYFAGILFLSITFILLTLMILLDQHIPQIGYFLGMIAYIGFLIAPAKPPEIENIPQNDI